MHAVEGTKLQYDSVPPAPSGRSDVEFASQQLTFTFLVQHRRHDDQFDLGGSHYTNDID